MIFAEVHRARALVPDHPPEPGADDSCTAPGVMRLQAVRDPSDRIVDFIWEFGNAAAARMMYCAPADLPGKHLLDNVAGPLGHPMLVERYRRVIEHGNAQSFAQVHLLDGLQDIVVHHVAREGDGVVVTLTNQSADRRAWERRLFSAPWVRANAGKKAA